MALAAVSVVDLFFFHRRGRAMGIFTVLMTNGGHLAPIVGGLIGQFLGWRWTFKLAALVNAFMLVVIIFCLPETLYLRHDRDLRTTQRLDRTLSGKSYLKGLRLWSQFPELLPRVDQFLIPAFKIVM